ALPILAGDNNAWQGYKAVRDLNNGVSGIFRQHRNVLLASNYPENQEIWLADYAAQAKTVQNLLDGMGRYFVASETSIFNQVRSDYAELVTAMEAGNAAALQRSAYNANQINDEVAQPMRDQVNALIDSIVARNEVVLDSAATNANGLYEQSRLLLISLLIGSVLIAAVAATWIVMA